MSRIYITASSDTSIYERYANLNTGHDEILEVGKKQDSLEITNGQVRSLIKFTLTDLLGAPTTSNAYLNLKIANATKLNQNQLVYVYPVSRSWEEGSGYFEQSPIKSDDGATWTTYASASNWSGSSDAQHGANSPAHGAGGDYNFTPVVSASVADIINDEIRINVTPIIQPMVSASAGSVTSNYGMMMAFSGSSASNIRNVGNIKFFSRQTHTVHAPTLEFVWANHSIVTGSLKTLSSLDIEIAPRNMKAEYNAGSVLKMYFTVRDKYPAKAYANTRRFKNRYYLPPSGSIYTIVDAGSGTTVVPFDEYSHLDCDTTGSYLMLDTKPLYKNRFYDLSLKITLSNEVYFSRPFRFKVV
jgi:hypothetical protein